MKLTKILIAVVTLIIFCSSIASAETIMVNSSDVPKTIVDNNPTGFGSSLSGPALFNLTDINLIFGELLHTSIPDLHIELTSPVGTNVVLFKAYTEDGILKGYGTPDNFINTVFDDQAATNLQSGTSPYTGSYNINHSSVVTNPLSIFNGEDAPGTWNLFISDLADYDVGTLNSWGLQFTGSSNAVPEPATMLLYGLGFAGAGLYRRMRKKK